MDEGPNYDVSITADGWSDDAVYASLRMVIETVLRRYAVRQACLEVCLVPDASIAELNERFLGHEGATDVLTFDLGSEDASGKALDDRAPDQTAGFRSSACRETLEGQIVVSHETARREADERGHSLVAELSLYVVHGLLHLLGYDDHGEADAARMHAAEDEVLIDLGLGPVFQSARE